MENKMIVSKDLYGMLAIIMQSPITGIPFNKVKVTGETKRVTVDIEIDHLATEPILIVRGEAAQTLLESMFDRKNKVQTDNQAIIEAAEKELPEIKVGANRRQVTIATLEGYPPQFVTKEERKGLEQTILPIVEYDVTFRVKGIWEVENIVRK